ncbi:MAG: replication factor C large subunit [Methanomicrobiales archaeon]|nr:replication factor C large subunit [Methanomicrobiales archaeon]MDD1660620.1 replication factor C large subunit [Methanomicrobiales archaeon]
MDWAEKYRPVRLQDIVGNTAAVRQVFEWAKGWSRRSKPLLLYGKPGTGKTSSAHALARDMGWEILELNASDQRTKAVIDRVAGSSSITASLSGASRKLILLDEADNLQGNADRGGARGIIDTIRRSHQPIILVANDVYGLPPELRGLCEPVQFRAVQARSLVPRLKFICTMEKIRCSETVLARVAARAGGDVRAAINMLHAAATGRESLGEEDLLSSEKDDRPSIFDLIASVYRGTDDRRLMQEYYGFDEPPSTLAQWIEGSLVHLQDLPSREKAYRCLARADEFLGLTYRRQYFPLWRYASPLLLLGTMDAAAGRGIHARITPPSRWQRMGTARKQKALRTGLVRRLSGMTHLPEDALRDEYLTLITLLVERDPDRYTELLSLDTDELTLFIHDRTRAEGVVKSRARKAREEERQEKKEKPAVEPKPGKKAAGGQSPLF